MRPVKLAITLIAIFSATFLTAQKRAMGNLERNNEIIMFKADNRDEYSSTLDLNDERKQLIMAGQNYNTNYGIYAEIKTSPSYKGESFKTIEHIKFEIFNYKPTYFIGIDSVVVSKSQRENDFMLKIYTKGLSENKTFELNKIQLGDLHMERGSFLRSERILNPLFVDFDAKGKPVKTKDGRIACKADNGKVFDFEFFYKDGLHVVRKQDYDKEEEKKQFYRDEEVSTLPAGRCRNSSNRVLF